MSRTQYNAICSQPLTVMEVPSRECPPSETFWADQGINEVNKQADRDDRTQYVVEYHDGLLTDDHRRARRARKRRGRSRQSQGMRGRAWENSLRQCQALDSELIRRQWSPFHRACPGTASR